MAFLIIVVLIAFYVPEDMGDLKRDQLHEATEHPKITLGFHPKFPRTTRARVRARVWFANRVASLKDSILV